MPGHILQAICGCGYETEVCPGYSMIDREERAICYNADFSNIETKSFKAIKDQGLEILVDPFITTPEEEKFIESIDIKVASVEEKQKLSRILMKTQEGVSDACLCPRCKNRSLFFHFAGHWD